MREREAPFKLIQEQRFRMGQVRRRVPSTSPVGLWFDDIRLSRQLPYAEALMRCGIVHDRSASNGLRWRTDTNSISLQTLSTLLEHAPSRLDLTPEETDSLSEAVAATIVSKTAGGKNLHGFVPKSELTLRRNSPVALYTGGEAAKILGVSRQEVQRKRKTLGIENILLTEGDIERMRSKTRRSRNQSPKHASNSSVDWLNLTV